MSILSEWHGEFVSQYLGRGEINGEDCNFEIGQKKDGSIVLYSTVEIRSAQENEAATIELAGIVENGIPVIAKGKVSSATTAPLAGSLCLARGPFEFTVGDADWARAHEIRFTVTNFLFCYSVGRTGELVNNPRRLDVNLDGKDVTFEKASQYDPVWSKVGLGQSTEITCELVVRVGRQTQDDIHRLSNAVCDLLSIGTGRIINWIYYEAYDCDGSLVYVYRQNRYTNRKAGSELIDFSKKRTAINFLEQCYPAYLRYNARHPGILHGIGRLLLDATAPEFKQTSALLVCAIVDALSKRDSSERDFRKRIEHLSKTYGVCLDDDEIDAFARSRDSLARHLSFCSHDGKSEYARCLSVLRRVVLGVLGYQGE